MIGLKNVKSLVKRFKVGSQYCGWKFRMSKIIINVNIVKRQALFLRGKGGKPLISSLKKIFPTLSFYGICPVATGMEIIFICDLKRNRGDNSKWLLFFWRHKERNVRLDSGLFFFPFFQKKAIMNMSSVCCNYTAVSKFGRNVLFFYSNCCAMN